MSPPESLATCFVYGRLLDPVLLEEVAPDARFDRIAHLPGHRLAFSVDGSPVIVGDEGHTVWGAVFSLPEDQVKAVGAAELGTRAAPLVTQVVDRAGIRIDVHTYSAADDGRPRETDIAHMIEGGRHWELPAGWVVGLEDLIDPFDL